MKRLLALVAVVLFALSACSVPSNPPGSTNLSSDPNAQPPTVETAQVAVYDWVMAQQLGDCTQIKKLATDEDSIDCDEVVEKAGMWTEFTDGLEPESFDVEVVGESALATLENEAGDEAKWELVWIDNQWLVLLESDDS